MPSPRLIDSLPEEIRAELDARIAANGFGGYEELSLWLKEQGFEISRSTIGKYGKEFKEKAESIRVATEQAKAIAEVFGDEAGDLVEVVSNLAYNEAFQILLNKDYSDQDMSLPKLMGAIANLSRSSVGLKRFRQEVREKLETTAEKISESAKAEGMSEEKAAWIRQQILGVVK